jgi:magnesium-transporting ATPase (P-type)
MDHPRKGLLKIGKVNFSNEIRFSLGVEPVDHDVLKRPPRKVTDPMIDKKLIINMVTSAAVIVIGTLCVFYAEVFRLFEDIEIYDMIHF